MSLRIGTNVASLAAQRHLQRSARDLAHSQKALASGTRFVSASDDSASFAVSESLRAQARSLGAAKSNAEAARGFVQVAEGGLNEQNNILIRLRELALQASSDTLSDDEREFVDIEFTQLIDELDRIAKTSVYGNKKLLQGSNEEFEFHVGTNGSKDDIIEYRLDADTQASALGVSGMSVSDQGDARDALESIDEAMLKITGARAGFGAMQSRLEFAGNNIEVQRENVLAARSQIADTDVAAEVSNMVAAQVQQDFGVSVVAQANQNPSRALRLIS